MTADRTCRHDTWWRSAPVLVIAVVALLMSAASGAYAAVANNSVGNQQLKINAVTGSKIKADTIQSSDIGLGAIKSSDIGVGAIQSSDIRAGTLSGSDIKASTITSSDIKNGSLVASDFAAGQLAPRPAASSRIYFAKVDAEGALLARSKGIASSLRVPDHRGGGYAVGLDFDATGCGLSATANTSEHGMGMSAVVEGVSGTTITVRAWDAALDGAPEARTNFSVTIVC